jgi:serine/threonine protein kinase
VAATLLNSSYEVVSLLGAGGFGVVLLARDVVVGHLVAIKVLRDPRARADELIREMRVLTALQHPGVVTFHHHFEHEGKLHLVMEYCVGGSMRLRLTGGAVTEDAALDWVKALAGILAFVHASGVAHHDIKPDNVLFGPNDSIKIGDFGIANQLGGTPSYAAPEWHRGAGAEKDGRADIYSLGMTLLELLTGTLPFHSLPRQEILTRKERRDFVPTTLAPWLREVLMKATQPTPELRFQRMEEFQEALETHHVRYVVNANRVRAHALAMEAETLMAQHRLERARKKIIQARHFEKNSVPALVASGRYSLITGQTKKAETYLNEAIATNPRAQIQKELAWLAMERGDYPYAISVLNDHLERNCSDHEAANLLVQCFFDLDRFEYARRLCDAMLRTQPKNTCFHNNRFIAALMETGNAGEALEKEPANPFLEYNRRMAGLNPPSLKGKLLFQDFRFGDPAMAKPANANTLILRRGERARYEKAIVTLGRDPENDVQIDAQGVSRWHCAVVNFRENVWLYDLRSTQGTQVDGVPVVRRVRIDGVYEAVAGGARFTIASAEDRLV